MINNNFNVHNLKKDIFTTVWEKVNDVYPLFYERKINWHEIRNRYKEKINNVNSFPDLYDILNNMLLQLRDPHTKIYSSYTNNEKLPPLIFTFKENDLYVYYTLNNSPTIKPGMKVSKIDGLSIEKHMEKMRYKINFTSLNMRNNAFESELIKYIKSKSVNIEVIGHNDKASIHNISPIDNPILVNKKLSNNISTLEIKYCNSRIIDNIGYIKIHNFSNKKVISDFQEEVYKCKGCASFIIDIRSNSGGLIDVAKEITSMLSMQEKVILYKISRKKNVKGYKYEKPKPIVIRPKNSIKYKKLAILCNEKTSSSAEYILLNTLIHSSNNIKVFGTKTAGFAHEATRYTLFDKSILQVTTSKYLDKNKVLLKEDGISPDYIVKISIDDLIKGRDTVLDCAIEFCTK
ncbi:peptidase S41 [Tepiditoga spiralis]|uniref:Peptidase S41 n=1 Tax=Tepiditoga spiralis TaxID=2108365 RepID=A0A7G1G9V1_9BACT|nr:S41 family peptidase [Tepiditoga spiralis]BBE31793.1 peptidase S41 [Tepiditoga spiralis]